MLLPCLRMRNTATAEDGGYTKIGCGSGLGCMAKYETLNSFRYGIHAIDRKIPSLSVLPCRKITLIAL